MKTIGSVLSLIVFTAMLGVILGSKQTTGTISALANGFANILKAATGK